MGKNCRFCKVWEIAVCREGAMKGDYPRFKVVYAHEELVVHFLPTSHDLTVCPAAIGTGLEM
jgi:hypothetical protein